MYKERLFDVHCLDSLSNARTYPKPYLARLHVAFQSCWKIHQIQEGTDYNSNILLCFGAALAGRLLHLVCLIFVHIFFPSTIAVLNSGSWVRQYWDITFHFISFTVANVRRRLKCSSILRSWAWKASPVVALIIFSFAIIWKLWLISLNATFGVRFYCCDKISCSLKSSLCMEFINNSTRMLPRRLHKSPSASLATPVLQ